MAKKPLYTLFLTAFFMFNVYKILNNYLIDNFYKMNNISCSGRPLKCYDLGEIIHFEDVTEVPLMERLAKLNKPKNITYAESDKVIINNKSYSIPLWQYFLFQNSVRSDDFYLVTVLQVRLYSYDKAKWSINELKQWFHYLFLAGVEHILICDHFMFDHEKFENEIQKYVKLGLVSYFPWNFIRNPMLSQIKCYNHFIKKFKNYHAWHMAIDIDEYPFSLDDCKENFLVRFLQKIPEDISEVSMSNYLMLGSGDRSQNMVIRRINRMTKDPANALSKPIYRPKNVRSAAVHHNHLSRGRQWEAPHDKLRMLHYWGARVQDWGPDTNKTLDITTIMNEMLKCWGPQLEVSLLTFNESSALTHLTGP